MREQQKGWLAGICLVFLVASVFMAGPSSAQKTEMKTRVYADVPRSATPLKIDSYTRDGVVYSSLKDIADALHLGFYSNKTKKKDVLRSGSRNITVTAYNPFILVDDDVFQLALVPVEYDDTIYVPAAHFINIINAYVAQKAVFDTEKLRLRILNSPYNLFAVDIGAKDNGYLLTIHTNRKFKKSDIAASIKHNWLNVTIYGGKLDSTALATKKKQYIVDEILPFQFKKSSYISFKLNKKIVSHAVYIDDDKITVSLRTVSSIAVANGAAEPDRKKWLIDTIIIDPGHGGRHPGCIGSTGITEKTITLDIALKLKRLLEKNTSLNVLLTRDSDSFMGLKERTQFANKNGGKLFISIHANASENRRVRGFSTWVLGHGKSDQALEVAEKENSVIEFEDSPEAYKEFGDAAHILNAIANSSYQKESIDLAQMVNKHMGKNTKIPMWGKGVYQAGFYVLIGAAMPRILVEAAFLSNKYEERLLRTKAFRQKIAVALFESIKEFKNKYEKGIG